jgi:two-component sensor histidine kinase
MNLNPVKYAGTNLKSNLYIFQYFTQYLLSKTDNDPRIYNLITIYKKEGNVKIDYDIDEEIELETERVIYLGLIINEILSNTFKFELNTNKVLMIKISIKSIDGIIEIIIKDNGPGFIKANVKEGSLGLKLINIMCTQLEAVHEIKSDKGVTHKIKFSFVKT